MLVTDAYGERFHLNPNQVVLAYTTKDDEDFAVDLPWGETLFLDRESYDRIVSWMEQAK